MTPDIKPDHKAAALAKLARLQKSPNYRSFFDADAIEAFAKVEGSAFAGTSLKKLESDTDPSRWNVLPNA